MTKLTPASPWPFVGMAGIASAFFLYAASPVVGAPWWGVVLLMLVWVAFLVVSCVWWTPYPKRLPFVALTSIVVWFLALFAGHAWFGWTA